MNTSNVQISAKDKIAENRKFHQETFKNIGVPDAFYTCKLNWKPKDYSEKVISCFVSELKKEDGIYVEFTDREFNPEDPKRKLYKLNYNPHYKEEYAFFKDDRYLVPVSYLIDVVAPDVNKNINEVAKEFALDDADDDCPIELLSGRDIAAIFLKKPVSRKRWLNEIIKNS